MNQISSCVQFLTGIVLLSVNVLLSLVQSETSGSGSKPKPAWARDPKE